MRKLFCSGVTFMAVAAIFVALAMVFVAVKAGVFLCGWYVILSALAMVMFDVANKKSRFSSKFINWLGFLGLVGITTFYPTISLGVNFHSERGYLPAAWLRQAGRTNEGEDLPE